MVGRFLCTCALALAAASTVEAGKIYWTTSEQRVQRANLNGSRVEDVLDLPSGPGPWILEISTEQGKLYFTDRTADAVRRSNLDGSSIETLVTGLSDPWGLALDTAGGKLYWTDRVAGKIQRANSNGSNVEDLVLTCAAEIALDTAGGKMYWTGCEPKIERADLDGSNVEDLGIPGLVNPRGIALDLPSGKLYFTDFNTGQVRRADLDGSDVELLFDGVHAQQIALDVVQGKMYWAGGISSGPVQRADLDGSNVEILAEIATPNGVALAIFGVCGDGTLDDFEECDDGNVAGGDGCQGDCLLSVCGDGIVDAGEQCDDGNLVSCDGCSAECASRPGFVCGDAVLNEECGEECDDGNNTDSDGCQGDCQLAECGDGIIDAGEQCDDGDAVDIDECRIDCTFPANVLYDQTDLASGAGVFDQEVEASYSAYDSEGADDFIVTFPATWDVQTIVTPGESTAHHAPQFVSITFYEDSGGLPGAKACEFPMISGSDVTFVDGDFVLALAGGCDLAAGHWWVSQQVRADIFDSNYFTHFWSTRKEQNHHEGIWRNPNNGLGTGCTDWTPLTLCGGTAPDLLFQLRGLESQVDPEPVPAVGPLGLVWLVLLFGGGIARLLARRRGE